MIEILRNCFPQKHMPSLSICRMGITLFERGTRTQTELVIGPTVSINMELAWSFPVSGKWVFPILVRICSGLGQRRSVMALLMGAAGKFFRQFTLESAPTATDISL